jgi:cytosine/adenosine deaminase-related metal-dependent hydrolase
MHSHLLEVEFDEIKAREKYRQSAIDYAEACDWLGPDVWYAHLVHSNPRAVERLAATGTGIAHCPTSNCRLGSGIAPVVDMQKAGVPVSLAVDGSASAESGSMLQELNLAWLIHRATHGPDATTLEQVLDWGTRGGANLLGLQDTGSLSVGKQADLVVYDIDQPRFAGVHSTLLAPLMCGEPVQVRDSFVQGRRIMKDGHVAGLDERELTRKVQEGVARMLAEA